MFDIMEQKRDFIHVILLNPHGSIHLLRKYSPRADL